MLNSLPSFIATKEDVESLFDYKDGNLYWKIQPSKSVRQGDVVGSKNTSGYLKVAYKQKNYLVHRLIFLLHHGDVPGIVDHIDNNRLNNKIENLRMSSLEKNQWNRKTNKNSSTGIKNVSYNSGSYKVIITANKEKIYLGRYADPELAELVACEGRNKYHQHYARHA